MNNPLLPPADWHIRRVDENALLADLSSLAFQVTDKTSVVITNHCGNARLDVWLVLERHTKATDDTAEQVYSFVDHATRQSAALDIARKYAYAVYRKDIAISDLPF